MSIKDRVKQTVDWRLCVSAALMLAMVFIVYNAMQIQQANRVKTDRIGVLIQNLQDESSAAARDRADAERIRILLLNYTQAQAAQLADLLRYLNAHGIHIPIRYLTPVQAPRITGVHQKHRTTPSRLAGGGSGGTSHHGHTRGHKPLKHHHKKHHHRKR